MREKIVFLIQLFDLKKFIKFGLIGVLNTLVDFAVFYVMDRWVIREGPTLVLLGMTVVAGPYLSNAIAYVVANVHSFVWNKLWTFERRDRVTRGEVCAHLHGEPGGVHPHPVPACDRPPGAPGLDQPAGQAAHRLRHHFLQLPDE